MSLIHILLTAASLSAFAGGAWSAELALDRYARIPDQPAEAAAGSPRDDSEEEDPRLIY